ncbi:MAG: N-acetyltransferase [Myxococcota bacterium]
MKSWWPIYEGCDEWVPPLIFERKRFFHPQKNPYFQVARVQCFMAYRDGVAVGTIAATVDEELQKAEPGVGLFGFFEFVNDDAVAKGLFDAARAWLSAQGMTSVRGPFNFNTNHEFGLLIDGFDTPPAIANPHNLSYYQRMYEEVLGLEKAMDWYAYWMDKGPVPETIGRIAKRFMDRNPNIRIRNLDLANFDRDVAIVKEIYNDAWTDNWGHVHMTGAELDFTAEGLKEVLDPRLCFIAYVDDVPAAVSVTLLDFNQVAKKMNGRIFPFGWYHYLRGRSKIDALRIFILGVKREYQKLPIGAPLYLKTWENGMVMNIRGAEASLILETNTRMRGALEKLGARIYKTYRTYESSLATNR